MRKLPRRLLSLLLALVMILGQIPLTSAATRTYDGTEKLYVDLGAVDFWLNDNALTKANFYGSDDSVWADLTQTAGTIYEVTVPAGTWTNVFLVRGDPAYTGDDFGSEASTGGFAWNRTAAIPLDAEKNFIMTFFEDLPYAAWGDYDPDAEPELVEIAIPNGDFENGTEGWVISGFDGGIIEYNGNHMLNLWASNEENVSIAVRYSVMLTAGTYYFTCGVEGANMASHLNAQVRKGDTGFESAPEVGTSGEGVWNTIQPANFTLDEPAEVTFSVFGTLFSGYWAHLDDLKLYGTGALYTEPEEPTEIAIPNGDFENGTEGWELVGFPSEPYDNSGSSVNPTHVLNLWVSNEEQISAAARYSLWLTEGTYYFTYEMDGENKDSRLMASIRKGEDETLDASSWLVTTGWDNWSTHQTGSFTLEEPAQITFSISGTSPLGYWGHLDNLRLFGTGAIYTPPEEMPEILLPNGDFENGFEGWICSGVSGVILENTFSAYNTSNVLDLWGSDTEPTEISISYPMSLGEGTYRFTFEVDGAEMDSQLHYTVTCNGDVVFAIEDTIVTTGWDDWWTYTAGDIYIPDDAEVVFTISGTTPAGYWGHLDNLRLFGNGTFYTPPLNLPPIDIPNGDFESGLAGWSYSGIQGELIDNTYSSYNTSHVLDLWASDTEEVEISVSYPIMLTEGTYQFTFEVDGMDTDSLLHYSITSGEDQMFFSEDTICTMGWDNWIMYETEAVSFPEPTEIVFTISGTAPAGYWGHLDNLELFGTGAIAGGEAEFDHEPTIAVEKVNGVDADDFMRGTDVSSYLSIVNSGAKYYDYEGNELTNQGFFDLLAAAGFNYIRLRVWNDPYDAEGHGYGGGNCDVEAAKTMGLWATNAGMKVLIDFHYSDFWADPGKQKAPKAWAGYTADQKAEAVDAFTYNSLKTLLEAGVDVGMVQVGNETTGSICGESSWANKAKIFSAGSAAIRRISAEYDHPILVAIHFTNPERSGNYASQAQNLNNYNVDYDVFASSWYPYWHGTTSNLTTVLKQVADNYGKQVVIAETSWAWTLDDGDGHDNTVRNGNNSANNAYPFSVQGQADELVAATKALTAVGEAGIGVFYWENAWIPVQYAYDADGNLDNDILNSNKAKWEEFGSGWASSYAAEYDPNDAGVWFGGSACDNQANFDFNGKALDSLWTWKYMMVGTEEAVEQEILSIEVPELTYEPGATLTLPNTINVNYLVGGSANEPATWNEADVAAVDMNTPGLYQIHGTVTTQLGDRDIVLKVKITYPNLLLNFDFESSDLSMYTFSGNYDWSTDTPHGGNRCLHFYNASARSLDFSQTVTLEPGEYVFSLYTQGDAKGGTEQYIYVTLPDGTLTEDYALAGWAVWQHPELSFTVSETASVTVGAHIAYGAGGWGTFDDLYLGQAIPDPLTALLAQIDALNPLDYTGASWAALMAAAAGAQEGTVDLETLQYAFDNLELKSEAMALGSDISAAASGDRSYPDENGEQRKLYDIVTNDYGFSMIRLRTWTGDEDGPCGKNTIIAYAKLCADAGLRIMIDFHYADSWADPGKQPPPAAWNVTDDVSPEEADRVAQLLYDYTYDFISSMADAGVWPEWVQVGNEINSGMVWPLGSTTYMDNFVKLLQAGTDAVRAASPTTKIVIHRSSGEETANVLDFYQNLIDAGYTDFDVIGLSFYPSAANATYLLSCLENTFDGLYENFCADSHREIMITETGSVGGSNRNQSYNMIISEIRKLQAIPDGRGTGCMYWEIENAEYSGWGSNRRPTVVWKAFSPGADYINDKPVTGLALSETELSMQVNDALSLAVTFTPSNPDMPEVAWESSNPEVASVNLAGLVLALSVGETDITVTSVHTADGTPVSATCHVTVTPEIPGLKNGGFELGDQYWVIDENIVGTAKISNSDNHLHGTYSLHYYASADGLDIGFTQAITGLEPGKYTLACRVMGESHEATGYIYADTAAKTHFQSEDFQTTGWTSNESGWIFVELNDILVGEDGELLVGAKVTAETTTAWGDFDDFTLVKQETEPEYYLVGDMNEWTPDEAFKLIADEENEGRFILEGVDLTADTGVKVYDAANDVWYPDGTDNNYIVTEDGVYDLEFFPAGEMGEEYHGGFFKLTKQPEPPAPEYYLVGSMNEWTPDEAFKLVADEETEGRFILEGIELTAGMTLKVYDAVNDVWYPDQMDNYGVMETGIFDLEFFPAGEMGEDYYGGFFKLTLQSGPQPQDPEYYLVGSMNEWTPDEAFKLIADEETEGRFILEGIELTAGMTLKVYDAVNDVWYPDQMDNYGVMETGTFDLEFFPAGEMGEDYYGGFFKLTKQPEPPAPEYYLVGTMNEWTPDEAFKLIADEETEGRFILENIELTAGTKVKVYDAANDVWYPDGMGNDFEVPEDGIYDLEFFPAGEMGEDYHGGFFKLTKQPEPPAPEYYLVGTMNNWTPEEAFKLIAGDEEGKFVLENVELTAGALLKIYDAVNDVWYPDGLNNDYEVAEDGTYLVEFWPAGGMGEEFHEGYFKLTKQVEPTPEPVINVFYVDEVGLDAVYCYAFGEDAELAAWPGIVLEPIGQDRNGHNVYEIELDSGAYDHVIFSNGSDWQTVDLPFAEDAGDNAWIVYFGNSNEADEQGHYKAWPAEDVEKIVSETAPSCTEPGEIAFESFVTGEQRTEVLEALGHDWDDGVVTKEPTTTEEGEMTYTCRRCGATRTEPIEKLSFLFDDVQDPAKFYYEPVYWAYYHDPQITNGTSDTMFSPNKICTRGQVVTFLWRAMGCPEPTQTTHSFTDVKETAYYYKAMLWAVETGVTTGTSETTFSPNKNATRGQVVTFLWRAMGCPEPTQTTHSFTDVKENAYYYKAMLWAVEAGITNGTSATTFGPNKEATRGHVVTFLFRAMVGVEPQ